MTTRVTAATATTVGALERALDTEHRAVYAYGLVGGGLTADALIDAQTALAVHANRRDVIARMLRDAGARPAPPAPGYRTARPVRRPADAFALAVDIEDACAAAYTQVLTAARPRGVRRSAVGWLRDAAVRSMRWRVRLGPTAIAEAPPLPGLAVPVTDTVRPTTNG